VYGIGLVKGLLVTLKHFFRPPFTVQFPEEVRPFPSRARTSLLWFDERCTGCSTCAQACPDGCILVATEPRADGSLTKLRYEIDFRICMYCGLCTEACPYEAIQAGGTFRDAVYRFDDMYHDKFGLTRLAHEYLRTPRCRSCGTTFAADAFDFSGEAPPACPHCNGVVARYVYPNGMTAPRSVVDFIEAEARGELTPPPGGTHAQIPSQPERPLVRG
jgi:NADH-quinone oxidoreductase subunit I